VRRIAPPAPYPPPPADDEDTEPAEAAYRDGTGLALLVTGLLLALGAWLRPHTPVTGPLLAALTGLSALLVGLLTVALPALLAAAAVHAMRHAGGRPLLRPLLGGTLAVLAVAGLLDLAAAARSSGIHPAQA